MNYTYLSPSWFLPSYVLILMSRFGTKNLHCPITKMSKVVLRCHQSALAEGSLAEGRYDANICVLDLFLLVSMIQTVVLHDA